MMKRRSSTSSDFISPNETVAKLVHKSPIVPAPLPPFSVAFPPVRAHQKCFAPSIAPSLTGMSTFSPLFEICSVPRRRACFQSATLNEIASRITVGDDNAPSMDDAEAKRQSLEPNKPSFSILDDCQAMCLISHSFTETRRQVNNHPHENRSCSKKSSHKSKSKHYFSAAGKCVVKKDCKLPSISPSFPMISDSSNDSQFTPISTASSMPSQNRATISSKSTFPSCPNKSLISTTMHSSPLFSATTAPTQVILKPKKMLKPCFPTDCYPHTGLNTVEPPSKKRRVEPLKVLRCHKKRILSQLNRVDENKAEASEAEVQKSPLKPFATAKPLAPLNHIPPNKKKSKFISSSQLKDLYTIKGKLGSGGGGAVYSGIRRKDGIEVAIKRVQKRTFMRVEKLEGKVVPLELKLLYEAAKTGNKNIIKIYDWYERRKSFIFVMEKPQPVMDLFDYLNKHGPMTEACARNIFRQLVKCVMDCHAAGILHRDIKDENVLINLQTFEAKLIDFGCGALLKPEAFTDFSGTAQFYPPEWFLEKRYNGKQLDAWALGVLLFLMVEGEVPFAEKQDIKKCQYQHKKKNLVSLSCRNLIALMLKKDPRNRINLNEVMDHPWMSKPDIPLATRSPMTPLSTSLPFKGLETLNQSKICSSSNVCSKVSSQSPATSPSKQFLPASSQAILQKNAQIISKWQLLFRSPPKVNTVSDSSMSPTTPQLSSPCMPLTPESLTGHERNRCNRKNMCKFSSVLPISDKLSLNPCFVKS